MPPTAMLEPDAPAVPTESAGRSAPVPNVGLSHVRPRVLAVTSEPPWPLDSGGHLRSFHLLNALASRTELKVVCPVQPNQEAALPFLAAAGINVRPVLVPARSPIGEVRRLAAAALRREPYVMYWRHHWRPAIAAWQDEHARLRPNLLYFDHLDSWLYASGDGSGRMPAVVDLHNIYSLLARRAAEEQPQPWKRYWLNAEARRLGEIEHRVATAPGLSLFAVSDTEAAYFRTLGASDVHAVPNGVDCLSRADLPAGRSGPPVVLFLGTMSWGPNISAALFLGRTVLPALLQRCPDARLWIVGANPPAAVREMDGGPITVTGAVPDVKPFLAEASVMAVPLDAGGGTRLKILEAFAAGLPVVSTRIGAEGISAEPGRHYVQAERPAFADALADVLANPSAGAAYARAARELACTHYDWRHIGDQAAAYVLAAAGRGAASEILEGPSDRAGHAPGTREP